MIEQCDRLNHQNRASKITALDCQDLFLSLLFQNRTETVGAVVVGLMTDGLVIYVPKYDYRGGAFLCDKEGHVMYDPELLNLDASLGKAIANDDIRPNFRKFPKDIVSLKRGDLHIAVTSPVSGSVANDFRVLDEVTVKIIADDVSNKARVSRPKILFIRKGIAVEDGLAKRMQAPTMIVPTTSKELDNQNLLSKNQPQKSKNAEISRETIHDDEEIVEVQRRVVGPGRFCFGGYTSLVERKPLLSFQRAAPVAKTNHDDNFKRYKAMEIEALERQHRQLAKKNNARIKKSRKNDA